MESGSAWAIHELAPDLVVLKADNASPMTLDGTRSYLLGRERLVLIDPGPDDESQLSLLREAVAGRPVVGVLLTHAHVDHSGVAARASREFEAPVRASGDTLARLNLAGTPFDGGDAMEIESGLEITAVPTPGHSADHTSFLEAPGRRLFTGDLVLGEGSSAILFPDGGVSDCLASLARLIALRPSALYPGHGPPVCPGLPKLEEYRRHRLDREQQVRSAITAGAASVPDIRRHVYGQLPEGLEWAADASVAAHLAALAGKGEEVPGFREFGSAGEEGPA